eukprot:GHRQ01032923.1.p1 GENE.GHRQ01032923.1~~GHRQ01032923.1.p1  ORF type:complete len:151 (+),score=42.17 GHRQ01032923.1:375-827(+)
MLHCIMISRLCRVQAGARSKNSSSTFHIKAKPLEQQQAGNAVPKMFMLEPSEEQRRYGTVKAQLLDALAPTPDTISAVGSDPVLTAGFDDPEVMSAVAEVARDPSAIKKYTNNPKVCEIAVETICWGVQQHAVDVAHTVAPLTAGPAQLS